MPLYIFECVDCKSKLEIFLNPGAPPSPCIKCESTNLVRKYGRFRVNVEYANTNEYLEKKLKPEMDELYGKIGREALNEDSNTLENLFGEDAVKSTYDGSSD